MGDSTQEEQVAATYHQTLMYHWMHQDNLMWGRMAFATATEGSAIVAYWQLLGGHPWIASALAVFVAFLLFETYLLVFLDQHDRGVNRALMDALAMKITPQELQPARTSAHRPIVLGRSDRWSLRLGYSLTDSKLGKWLTGGNLLTGSLLILIILDLTAAAFTAARAISSYLCGG